MLAGYVQCVYSTSRDKFSPSVPSSVVSAKKFRVGGALFFSSNFHESATHTYAVSTLILAYRANM